MVILLYFLYLALQSTIDWVGYAAGKTDEFRGTGVWSGIQFKREAVEDSVDMDPNKKTTLESAKTDGKEKTSNPSK